MAAPGGISAFLFAAAEYLPSYWLQLAAPPLAPKGEEARVLPIGLDTFGKRHRSFRDATNLLSVTEWADFKVRAPSHVLMVLPLSL